MKLIRLLACLLVLGCASGMAASKSGAAPANASKPTTLYVCDCGPDCKCTKVSVKRGKCGCGHALKAVHLTKLEGDTALVCSCDAKCKCTFDPKDPTKCGCGKPIQKVSLKGSGLYYCDCGGTCCGTVSAKAGKCKCGMELKRAT